MKDVHYLTFPIFNFALLIESHLEFYFSLVNQLLWMMRGYKHRHVLFSSHPQFISLRLHNTLLLLLLLR